MIGEDVDWWSLIIVNENMDSVEANVDESQLCLAEGSRSQLYESYCVVYVEIAR